MNRPLKLALIAAGAFALLTIAAMIIVPMAIDPNTYKPQIVKAVQDATGRTLKLDGEISVSVFPWLGAKVRGPVVLGNAAGFGDDPMVSLNEMDVKVKLLPLLSKKVEIGRIVIRNPVVNLGVQSNGRTNWDDLTGADKKLTPAEQGEGAFQEKSLGKAPEASPPMAVVVEGVEISGGTVTWDDKKGGQWVRISNLNFEADDLELGKTADIALACDFLAKNPQAKGNINLKTKALVNPDAKQARLDGTKLLLRLDEFKQEARSLSSAIDLATSAYVDWAKGDVDVKGLDLKITANATGAPAGAISLALMTTAKANWLGKSFAADAIQLNAEAKDMRLEKADEAPLNGGVELKSGKLSADWGKGDLSAQSLDLKAKGQGSMLPGGSADVTLKGDMALNWLQETLALSGFSLHGFGLSVTSPKLTATGFLSKPAAQGSIDVAEFSPKKLMASLGMEPIATTDPAALEKVALKATLDAAGEATKIHDLTLRLDETTMTGSATILDVKKPALSFDLKADKLDADRYLPPKGAKKAEPAHAPAPAPGGHAEGKPAPASTKDAGRLPVDLMKSMDLDGKLHVGWLKVYKIPAENINVHVLARNGVVKVEPFNLEIFKGKINLKALSDVSRPTPISNLGLSVVALDLDQVMMALTGESAVGAKLGLDVNLAGNGDLYSQIVKTLSGKVSLLVKEGVYRGVVLQADRFDPKQGYVAKPGDDKQNTTFKDFNLNFDVAGGVAKLQKTQIKTSGVADIGAAGSTNLAAQTLDFNLDANVGPFAVPIAVRGTYDEPSAGVDSAELAKRILLTPLNVVGGAVEGVGSVLGGALGVITGGGSGSGTTDQSGKTQQQPTQTTPQPQQKSDPVKGLFQGLGLEPKK